MQADAMAADTLSRVVPLEDLHRLFNIESDAVVGHTEIHHAHSLDLYRRRHDVDQPAGRHPPFNGLNRVGEQVTQNLHHRRGNTKRSEEHTSELQSLMRNSYAVFCLKKK